MLPDAPPLIHTEAGKTIRKLYETLDSTGYALETMGGASGQTLAGAISTGTHGGDKYLPPLADSVLAMHLVREGGNQYWIEPSRGITDPFELREHVVPDVDPSNVVYEDDTFDACLVSLGCMGVLYSVVMRVREPYDLSETTMHVGGDIIKANGRRLLEDPKYRFMQVLVNPYPGDPGVSGPTGIGCRLMLRSEAPLTVPKKRPSGDVEGAVRAMVDDMTLGARLTLNHNGVFEGEGLTDEERLAKIVRGVMSLTPDMLPVMKKHYGPILRVRLALLDFESLYLLNDGSRLWFPSPRISAWTFI